MCGLWPADGADVDDIDSGIEDSNRYLSEIVENNHDYDSWTREQVAVAGRLHHLHVTCKVCGFEYTKAVSDVERVEQLLTR